MKTFLVSCAAIVLFSFACGGETTSPLDDGGSDSSPPNDSATAKDSSGSCLKSSDCKTGELCGFLESEQCAATTGQCFLGGSLCNTFQPGCACDGTTINIACTGLPPGYATAPLAHSGNCADAN